MVKASSLLTSLTLLAVCQGLLANHVPGHHKDHEDGLDLHHRGNRPNHRGGHDRRRHQHRRPHPPICRPPHCKPKVCDTRIGNFTVISTPMGWGSGAEEACRGHGAHLAAIDIINFVDATNQVFACLGGFESAWIASWNGVGADKPGQCMALTVGVAAPGGAINPYECSKPMAVLCQAGIEGGHLPPLPPIVPPMPRDPLDWIDGRPSSHDHDGVEEDGHDDESDHDDEHQSNDEHGHGGPGHGHGNPGPVITSSGGRLSTQTVSSSSSGQQQPITFMVTLNSTASTQPLSLPTTFALPNVTLPPVIPTGNPALNNTRTRPSRTGGPPTSLPRTSIVLPQFLVKTLHKRGFSVQTINPTYTFTKTVHHPRCGPIKIPEEVLVKEDHDHDDGKYDDDDGEDQGGNEDDEDNEDQEGDGDYHNYEEGKQNDEGYSGNEDEEYNDDEVQDYIGNKNEDYIGNKDEDYIGNKNENYIGNEDEDYMGNDDYEGDYNNDNQDDDAYAPGRLLNSAEDVKGKIFN